MLHKVLDKIGFPKVENPLVTNTLRHRFHVWLCNRYGHFRTAVFYRGMPQSHCRRCGAENWGLNASNEKWVTPWGKYESRKSTD